MEHIFNVEAHAEYTGWHWCYEVSEIGTIAAKKFRHFQGTDIKCKLPLSTNNLAFLSLLSF
jgi:hypothetical protein